jgi:hypothetical protein
MVRRPARVMARRSGAPLVFEQPPGTTTYYRSCQHEGGGTAAMWGPKLTAVFVPD